MPDRYCASPSCGAKTPYVAKAPAFCSSCGQPFVKAFASTQPAKPHQTTQNTQPPVIARTARHQRPVDTDPDSTDYDESEVAAYARELAASVSASDFFSVTTAPNAGFTLSDVLDKDKHIDVGIRGTVVTDPSQLPALPE